MTEIRHYAHSLKDRPLKEWHDLVTHLTDTGTRAEEFARAFGSGWANLAGIWHDAGKYQLKFQQRIGVDENAHTNESVDHSSVGALIARHQGAEPLSFVIAGHHGGLPNFEDLKGRLASKEPLLEEARRDGLPAWLEQSAMPNPPLFVASDKRKLALWIRMTFSALVDADFLDTERFYQGAERVYQGPGIAELLEPLEAHLAKLTSEARDTPVNAMRHRVMEACKSAADMPQGLFTLTVPTGGAKTLASLLFALRHAAKRELKRVIVVVPYTSIIEQTAKVFRDIFGQDAVVEHHSNVDPEKETKQNRLASENWDTPLVVTTSVQFFESLFSNRTSRCRKLHRIPESVVIFDEVQTLPVGLLSAIRDVLHQLAEDYRTSAVLCTATQPSLGIRDTREIIRDVSAEFAVIANRCSYSLPTSEVPESWAQIAARVILHDRVLVIVNKRKDAEQLSRLCGGDCFHLSARMCAAHRSEVLAEIRKRLKAGTGCRTVATQLIEAGVDIDFPVVFRAFAGADSMAQAAGRCNREGGEILGRLFIFIPPSEPPKGVLLTAKQRAFAMWQEGKLDLTQQATFGEYFRLLYGTLESDRGVLAAERDLRFKDVAELFQMIEAAGELVIAPYGDFKERVEQVRTQGLTRLNFRRLQPFGVQLYKQEVNELVRHGALKQVDEKLWAVANGYEHVYSLRFGFAWQGGRIFAEPESLIG